MKILPEIILESRPYRSNVLRNEELRSYNMKVKEYSNYREDKLRQLRGMNELQIRFIFKQTTLGLNTQVTDSVDMFVYLQEHFDDNHKEIHKAIVKAYNIFNKRTL